MDATTYSHTVDELRDAVFFRKSSAADSKFQPAPVTLTVDSSAQNDAVFPSGLMDPNGTDRQTEGRPHSVTRTPRGRLLKKTRPFLL